MMNRMTKTSMTLVLLLTGAVTAFAQDQDWPRTVALDEGTVTIYAPQVEALDGDVLYYRAALAYRPQANAEPIFGAGWFKSPVDIDEAAGTVHPAQLELTQTRFPDGTADIQAEFATAMARQSSGWNLDFSVAELEAALDAAEAESLAAQQIKTAPPKIIYRDRPALLVTIDGDPVLREVENSPYEAVINTPYPLITDGDDYFLNAARGVWYRAGSATGPYRYDPSPPADIVKMVESAESETETETDAEAETLAATITADNAPEIVVSTEPAELIVTEGPADFAPLVDDLLVLQNSDDDVFMHVGTQQYYIVLAGRWYKAPSLTGPWTYQAADALPDDFAAIPDDSAQADSRVYVAGTAEAEEAVLDAHVPQTAKVERGEVDIDVDYDGDPEFDRVEGTEDLRYARNTGATVLNSDRVYYLLEDGVWYVSSSPHGPWVVSDHRPGELETIAPSSPVYHTKYVYVYDATPEVVYVGYTPGYLGSYVYANTIVYGTGYYYRPWVSPYYYYPRPRTWGFHVGYNDWSGWSFGLSWYWGPWSTSYYTGGYWHYGRPWYNRYWGYWGPRGYCYRPYYYGGYRHNRYAYHGHGKGHRGHGKYGYRDYDRWDNDYRRDDRRHHDRYDRQRHRNLYRDDRQRARIADSRDVWNNDPDWRNDPKPGRDRGTRFADNRKVKQSKTGPVKAAELRTKAVQTDLREVNRHSAKRDVDRRAAQIDKVRQSKATPVASKDLHARVDRGNKVRQSKPEPVSRSDLRARAVQRDKVRERKAAPVSRSDLRQRADTVASRNERSKASVNRPLPNPSRPTMKPERRNNERTISPPSQRNDKVIARDKRSSPRISAPSREVKQRAARTQLSRPIAPSTRRDVGAAPSPRPKAGSPRSAAPTASWQSRTAKQQKSRQMARPQTRAPRQHAQRSAPKQHAQRSAPKQHAQRSAPKQHAQRSAPRQSVQRNAPRPSVQRSAPKRENGPSRGQTRKMSRAEPKGNSRARSPGKSQERRRRN